VVSCFYDFWKLLAPLSTQQHILNRRNNPYRSKYHLQHIDTGCEVGWLRVFCTRSSEIPFVATRLHNGWAGVVQMYLAWPLLRLERFFSVQFCVVCVFVAFETLPFDCAFKYFKKYKVKMCRKACAFSCSSFSYRGGGNPIRLHPKN